MEPLLFATMLCLCASSCLATNYNHHQVAGRKDIHVSSPKVHLHHEGGYRSPLADDEPIILQNEKPLFIRKSIHGVPASSGVKPIVVSDSYGKSHLDLPGPVQSVKLYEGHNDHKAVLVRRPVVVSKDLTPTQDHLDGSHYEKLHLAQDLLNTHVRLHQLPPVHLSQGLHEKTLVYFNEPAYGHLAHGYHGLGHHAYGGHGLGHHAYAGHGLGHHAYGGHGLGLHGYGGLGLGLHGYGGHDFGHLSYGGHGLGHHAYGGHGLIGHGVGGGKYLHHSGGYKY